MGIFTRKRLATVTVDEVGVRKSAGTVSESVTWSDLFLVEVHTTDQGPLAEDVFWVLHGASDTGVVVPGSAVTGDLLERLQALPGFDNEALIRAMGSTVNAVFECWRKQGR